VWAAASAAVVGCGSASTPSGNSTPTGASTTSVQWTCANTDVPGGVAYECVSTDERTMAAAQALGGTYTCSGTGSPSDQCPPAEDGPIPDDAAAPGDDSSASTPPSQDGPWPDGGSFDDAAPPDQSGDDGGKGHGHGGPPSTPPGKGGTPPVVSMPDAGATPTPPYDCSMGEGEVDCMQPPACEEGTVPSACGACIPYGTTDDCIPPASGGCWVTGGGFIDPATGQDSFGGNAMPMKSGTIRGEWENVDHGSGLNVHGQPSYLYCRHVDEPGPGADNGPNHDFTTNQAYFGGAARVFANNAWTDGYWFDVVVDDHGEGKGAKSGGPDLYHITVRAPGAANQPGAIVYDGEGNLSGGNIQLHPPNNGHPYTGSALPSWVTLQP
jgi:hypothetical protein